MLSLLVALGIQHAMRVHHIVNCGLPGCTTFFHFISQTARFSGKKMFTHEMCLDFLNIFFSETFFILGRTEGDMIIN